MSDTVEMMAEEFKIAYPLTYDAIYNKGRADAEKEHTEMCNSCIHKVSKEDIDTIRSDAIDECIQLVKKYYNLPTVMIVEGLEKLKGK